MRRVGQNLRSLVSVNPGLEEKRIGAEDAGQLGILVDEVKRLPYKKFEVCRAYDWEDDTSRKTVIENIIGTSVREDEDG